MDLAEIPEIHMDAYIRIRRHGSCRGSWDTYGCWDTDPETWILQRSLRYIWMPIYGSGDMDLAEVPEIHMDAETWIRRHGSCRGSWDTYGCLYTDPETWILQRSLRYKDAETWIQRRGSCRGAILVDAETWIRRHGSCRESWDTKMLRHESGDMDLAEDPYWWMLRHESDTWIRRHGSCRGSWDIKMLRHESGDVDLAENPWDTKMLRHES